MDVKVSTPSMVRGSAVTAAMLVPGRGRFSRVVRTGVVAAGYLGSFALDPQAKPEHYTLMSFTGSEDVPDQLRSYGNVAVGTASWVGIQTLVAHAAALLPLPKTFKALLVGGGVAVADSWVGERVRNARAA
ncbi:hypothetical protein [Nakamurella lactea]|uniref:hypothetical protein n=1 Tax=Nakamurella lactea TaxID=459515 RepID=UPI0003F6348A|nr:hypothetical protein [Nakamurella lactea]